MTHHTRNRRVRPSVVVAASLVMHGAIAALIMLLSSGDPGSTSLNASGGDDLASMEIPERFACEVDAAAVVAARLVMCAAPLADNPARCAGRATDGFIRARVRCTQVDEALVRAKLDTQAITLIDESQLKNLKPMQILPDAAKKVVKEREEKNRKQLADKQEQAKKREEVRPKSAQVVEITRPKVEMAPEHSRFVSEFDSSVKKETVARSTADKMVERPGTQPNTKSPVPPPPVQPKELRSDSRAKDGAEGRPGLLAMRGAKQRQRTATRTGVIDGAKSTSEDGALAPEGDGARRNPASPLLQPGEFGEGGEGGHPSASLMPSRDMLERMVGGGSIDKLSGVENGETTALNSRRWKYASFFNRMKRRVAQNWRPASVFMRRDPTGRVYGTKDRITVLQVKLTRKGSLDNVIVLNTSGVDFLDDEAIRAFRKAQPFPNPPKGLVEGPKELITFSFGFHFQIDGRRDAWRVFRAR